MTWGVSYRPNAKWQMGVDLQWIGWSAYKDLNVAFNEQELGIDDIYSVKNYSNTLSARFGAEYAALDWLQARAGIYFDESPVDSNYLNPETPSMTKISYSAGLSFRLARCAALDVAYCYVSSADPERTGSYPLYDYASGELSSVSRATTGSTPTLSRSACGSTSENSRKVLSLRSASHKRGTPQIFRPYSSRDRTRVS